MNPPAFWCGNCNYPHPTCQFCGVGSERRVSYFGKKPSKPRRGTKQHQPKEEEITTNIEVVLE